jgi:hypothetical protein
VWEKRRRFVGATKKAVYGVLSLPWRSKVLGWQRLGTACPACCKSKGHEIIGSFQMGESPVENER